MEETMKAFLTSITLKKLFDDNRTSQAMWSTSKALFFSQTTDPTLQI